MSTYLPTAQENAAIAAMFPHATTVYVVWNTASPSTTGANQIAGFTRQKTKWSTPATGKEHNATAMTYVTAPSCTIRYFSMFTAITSGTYLGGSPTTSTLTVPASSKVAVAISAITLGVSG